MSKPNSPPKQNGDASNNKMDSDKVVSQKVRATKKKDDSVICLWSHEKAERNAKTTPTKMYEQEQREKKSKNDVGVDGESRELQIDTIFERTKHRKGSTKMKTSETLEAVLTKPPKKEIFEMKNFGDNPKLFLNDTKAKKGGHKKRDKMDAIKISASATNIAQIRPLPYETTYKKRCHKSKKREKDEDRELICYYKNESNMASDVSSKNDDDSDYQRPKIICKCFIDDSSELHIKNTCDRDPSNKLIDVKVINTTFGTTTKVSEEFVESKKTITRLKSFIPKPIENIDDKIDRCLRRFPKLYQINDLCGFSVDQSSLSDVPNESEDLCGLQTTFSSESSTENVESSTQPCDKAAEQISSHYQNSLERTPNLQPLKKLYEQKYGAISTIKEQIESVNEEISNMIKTALNKIETKSNYCCLNVDVSDTSDDEQENAKNCTNFNTPQNSSFVKDSSASALKRKSDQNVSVPKKKFKEDSPIFRLLENALEEYQRQGRTKNMNSEGVFENTIVQQMFSMLSHMEVLLEEYFHNNFDGYAHTSFVCSCNKRFTCDKSSQTAITDRFKPKSRYTIQTYTVFCSALSSTETQTITEGRLIETKSSLFGRFKKRLGAKNKSNQTIIEGTKSDLVETETQTDTKSGKFFGKIRTAVRFLSKKHSKTKELEDAKIDTKMLSPTPSTSGTVFSNNKITQTYYKTDDNIEEGFIKSVNLSDGGGSDERTKKSGYKKDVFEATDSSSKTSSLAIPLEDTATEVPHQKTNPEPALKHLTKPPKKAFKATKRNVKKGKKSKGDQKKKETQGDDTTNQKIEEDLVGVGVIENDVVRFDEDSLDYTLKDDFELKELRMKEMLERVHDMDRYYYKISVPKEAEEALEDEKGDDGTIEMSLDNVNLEEFDLDFPGIKKDVCCDVDKRCSTKSASTSTRVNREDVGVEALVGTHDVGTQPPRLPPKRDASTQYKSCTSKCLSAAHQDSLDLVPSLASDSKKKPEKIVTKKCCDVKKKTLVKRAENTPLFTLHLDSNAKIEKGTKISIPSDESRNKMNCCNLETFAFVSNKQQKVLDEEKQLTHFTAQNCSIPDTQPKALQTEEKLSNYYIIYMPEKLSDRNLNKNSAADFKIWYYFQNMPKSLAGTRSTTTLPNSTTSDTSSSIFNKILLLKKRSDVLQSDFVKNCDGANDEGRGDGYGVSSSTSISVDTKKKEKRVVDVQYVTLPMLISDGEEIYRERRRTNQNCF